MKRFNAKKITSVLLAAALTVSALPATASAKETGTEKEEVVYVNAKGDGTVDEINVVNILKPGQDGKVIDYGNYESLRNMTTTDEIEYSNDTVKMNTSVEKLYYEGKLEGAVMPWKLEVHYYLDGKEYSAEEMAGKDGSLKMTVRISKNEECQGEFYDSYALQASVALDTEKFKNISAPDATVANVGSDKQLTYTILPGRGADIEITAEVSDFQMDGFSVNGIPLNLDIEVDDEELVGRVTKLLDAIGKIDDGTGELKDGVKELQDSAKGELKSGTQDLDAGSGQIQNGAKELKNGGQSLSEGAKTLQDGAAALDEGMQSLNQGISQVQAGLEALDENSEELTGGSEQMRRALETLGQALGSVSASAEEVQELTTASSAVKAGIAGLAEGANTLQGQISFEAYKAVMAQNGLSVEELQAGNAQAARAVSGLLSQVSAYEAMLENAGISADAIAPVKNQCVALANQIVTLLNGNNAAIGGMQSYLNGLNQGAADLAKGAQDLKNQYGEFDTAIHTLADTLTNLTYQMAEMKDAVNKLVEEYSKLDDGLHAYTDGVAQVVAGSRKAQEGVKGLVEGSGALKSGSAVLYDGTAGLLNGIVELYDASGTLKDGTGKLDDGAAELIAGISALYDGAGELKDGTGELQAETSGMDSEITDQIDELLDTFSGGAFETVSFVSEKNTNVDSVQFVIKTDAIHTETAKETVQEEEEKPGVWQKFLKLFGR